MTHPVRLAAYVLTLNEERHIGDAVASLRQVTANIVIVDSGSIDATAMEAHRSGAVVDVREFDSFDRQRTFALAKVVERFDPEWVLTIDADERLSAALVQEISETILTGVRGGGPDAYLIPRVVRFEGRVLRFGGAARTRLLRLYRPTAGRYESRSVNEHFALTFGKRLAVMKSPIEHGDVTSWERHIAKHNLYSTLEAEERATAGVGRRQLVGASQALRAPDLRRRWLRERVWNRLPAKPLLRFIQMYIFAGGFLDGGPGFDLALLQAWQEMCTERKFRELLTNSGDVRRRRTGV